MAIKLVTVLLFFINGNKISHGSVVFLIMAIKLVTVLLFLMAKK